MRTIIPNEFLVSNGMKLNIKTRQFSDPDPPFDAMMEVLRTIAGVEVITEMKGIGTVLISINDDKSIQEIKDKLPTCNVAPHGLNK